MSITCQWVAKKSGTHVKVITEHIIAILHQNGDPARDETKESEIKLWDIMRQYPHIIHSYQSYEGARNKNIWLKRLLEGLYKSLYAKVAPHYTDFKIKPDIFNFRTNKYIINPAIKYISYAA